MDIIFYFFMKKTLLGGLFLSIFFTFTFISDVYAVVSVRGYYRSNGTYVAPHYRSDPDTSFSNNWSTKGNVNPYTGEEGTKDYPDYYGGSYGSNFYPPVPNNIKCEENRYFSSIDNKCVCNSGYIENENKKCVSKITFKVQECRVKLGNNSEYNSLSDTCKCMAGYIMSESGSRCNTPDEECKAKYGYYSSYFSTVHKSCQYCAPDQIIDPASNTCSCLKGFYWDANNKQCVSVPSCGINQQLNSGFQCECREGYLLKEGKCLSHNENCQLLHANSYGDENGCYCNKGYKFDSDKNLCLVDCGVLGEGGVRNGLNCECKVGYSLDNLTGKCNFLAKKVEEVKNNTQLIEEKNSSKMVVPKVNSLRVRENPSDKAKTVFVIKSRGAYKILREDKNWIQIRLDNMDGWVMRKYVQVKESK